MRPLLLAAAVLACAAAPLAAQTDLANASARPIDAACFDRLPASAFTRVAVYVTSAPHDSTLPPAARAKLLASADDLLQEGATRVRRRLAAAAGVADTVLPSAEPLLGDSTHAWRGVGSRLVVTAFRDGRLTWRVPQSETADTLAAALLARALDSAVTAGGTRFWWPPDSALQRLDSASFDFRFVRAYVDRNGKPQRAVVERPIEAVFSMLAPWEEPLKIVRVAYPKYPETPKERGYRANVTLRFVIDTTGHARPETVRAILPSGPEALVGDKLEAYNDFVAATRRSVLATRFAPGSVGGCAVEEDVQQSFGFTLAP